MSTIIKGQNFEPLTDRQPSYRGCTTVQEKFTAFSDVFWSISSGPITPLVSAMWKIIRKADDHFYQEKIRNEPRFSSSKSQSIRWLSSSHGLKKEKNKETVLVNDMVFEIESSDSRRSSLDTARRSSSDTEGMERGLPPLGFPLETPAYLFSNTDPYFF